MAMPYEGQHLDRLRRALVALDRGDWRTAWTHLFGVHPSCGREELVDLEVCLRCVTRSMRHQCVAGDVRAALYELETAARRLPAGALGVGPVPARPIARLAWATARLVLREQADLDAIRLVFGRLRRGRQELVHACVEHLTWVEFDPWTVLVREDDRALVDLDTDAYARFRIGNCGDICTRATSLRQFTDTRDGTVSEKTWQRMGGYPGVREEALRVLAAEPRTRGLLRAPVRFGRLRAWEYARQWVIDTSVETGAITTWR